MRATMWPTRVVKLFNTTSGLHEVLRACLYACVNNNSLHCNDAHPDALHWLVAGQFEVRCWPIR